MVIDGLRPGVQVDLAHIQRELDRRRPGQSTLVSPRREADRVEVLSGVFEGKTTGAPIALLVRNHDADPSAYAAFKESFRPGHADYSYWMKYGVRDWRGGGRSSGRETVARVAAGAVARAMLESYGVSIRGHLLSLGEHRAERYEVDEIERNPLRCADPVVLPQMMEALERARVQGDSLGCVVELRAQGVPAGWGDPVFAKLDACMAAAMMSIGGVKGVELGDGFDLARLRGSQANDQMRSQEGRVEFCSNHAGGILGGISTGGELVLRLAVKPTPSIAQCQETVDIHGAPQRIHVGGRHDPCLGPRLIPVAEAMMALVLADAALAQAALSGAAVRDGELDLELARCELELQRLQARREALLALRDG